MPGGGGLAGKYPLSHYQLDYYVDNGVTGVGNVPATIAQFFASLFFFVGALLMRCVIAAYDWSTNLNIITGAGGGLDSSSNIVQDNYTTLVAPFMITAILCFGIWLAYKAVKRDQAEIGAAIGRVLVLSVIAIAVVWHPQDTIGRLYDMSDDVSKSISSVGGNPSDTIWNTFVYKPHAILQHGGTEVCTSDKKDKDGFPLAVDKGDPTRTECHSVLKKDSDGHGDYERRFLAYAPGSPERKAVYDALREGRPVGNSTVVTYINPTVVDPNAPPQPAPKIDAGYQVDKTDAPAVDMMQADGALQRLVFTILTVIGMAGGILLLGLIVIAKLFAQIAILMLYMASSFMILAAAFPGAHGIVISWAKLLGKVLVSAIVFSLLLAITLNTSRGIMALGQESDGYFIAFGLQAILFLGVFFKRKAILRSITSSKTAKKYSESEHQAVSFATGAATGALGAVSGGATTFASTMRDGWNMGHGSGTPPPSPGTTSPPASAGRSYSPTPDSSNAGATTNGSSPSAADTNPGQSQWHGSDIDGSVDPVLGRERRSFSDDLNQARSDQYDQEYTGSNGNGSGSLPGRQDPIERPIGIADSNTFARDLEEARREQELERRE